MPNYKIYAGLDGSFGGANYVTTEEFENESEANMYAWELACEEYDSMAGVHGLKGYEDAVEAVKEEYPDIDEDHEEFEQLVNEWYESFKEDWVAYYAVEVND